MNKNTQEKNQRLVDTYKLLVTNNNKIENIFNVFTTLYRKKTSSIYFDEDGKKISYNYAKYKSLVIFLAKHLSYLCKELPKGNVIALKMKNSPNWPLLFWAILMSGYKVLLVDARLAHQNTENVLHQANAKIILTNDVEKYEIQSYRLNEIKNSPIDNNFSPCWENEIIFLSSGTTGQAKMFVMNGENLINQIKAAKDLPKECEYLISYKNTRLLAMIPFHHIFGFIAVFLWYTFFGKAIVYPSSIGTNDLIYALKKAKVTNFYSVPLFWDSLALKTQRKFSQLSLKNKNRIEDMISYNLNEKPLHKSFLARGNFFQKTIRNKILGNSLRFCISGGGYLSYESLRLINGLGYNLHNGYGMTEIGISSVNTSSDPQNRINGNISHPFYNYEYKIIDKNGNETNYGELLIKSKVIHFTQIIDGERIKPDLENEYFHTGDIALKDENNDYFIKGRIKDTIISSNGENIFPDEIESYYKNIKYVQNCAVCGIPNKNKEEITLILEINNRITDNGLIKLKQDILDQNAKLPNEKKPVNVYVYKKSLPISGSMKVKRLQLKDEIIANSPNIINFFEEKQIKSNSNLKKFPSNEVEEVTSKVKKIFSKTLSLPEFKFNNDDIWNVDLGGDSMSYISLIENINDEFKIQIPTDLYGKIGSVNDFSEVILTLKNKNKV